MDLGDAAVSMLWSLSNRTVGPAGKSIEVGLHRGTDKVLHMTGRIDYSTIALRVVALVTLAMSGGDTLLVRKAVKEAVTAKYEKVLAARKAGGRYTNADAARDTARDSDLGRQLAATNPAFTAHVVNQALVVAVVSPAGVVTRPAGGLRGGSGGRRSF